MSTFEQFYPKSPEELKQSRKLLGIPANMEQFNALDKAINAYKKACTIRFCQPDIDRTLSKKALALYDKMRTELETVAQREAYNAIFEAAKAFVETCDPDDITYNKLEFVAEK